MDITRTHSVFSAGVDGAAVGLRFHRLADRWAHEIVVDPLGRSVLMVASVEGSDSDPWPPSPPLQEITEQTIEGRSAILAVGMAGSSHWSASFVAGSCGKVIDCDIACRAKSPFGPVGTRYSLAESVSHRSNDQEVQLRSESLEAVKLIIRGSSAFPGKSYCSLVDNGVATGPAVVPAGELTTVRWKYTLSICG